MIRLEHLVLNILDKNTGNLVCAQKEIELTDGVATTYVDKMLKKIQATEGKMGALTIEHPVVVLAKDTEKNFVEKAETLANKLFSIIAPAEEVTGGDLIVFQGKNEVDEELFGIVMLNYSNQYTHFVDYEEDGLVNKLIVNQAILPSPAQRVNEAIIINLAEQSYHLLEKKYRIEGEKVHYFSELFLEINTNNPVSEDIKTIKKAVDTVAEKFNEEKYLSRAQAQEAVYDSIDRESMIDPEYVAEVVFPKNIAAREAYLEEVRDKGVVEKIPVANAPKYEKKYSKQKFKLDNGIELVIPIDVYKNKDMIEFVNNPDGTLSVIIKNIDEVTNQFS